MIIKTFTAESSAAALKQVRAELGRDAVVLKTRELTAPGGITRIEITACLDGQSAPVSQPSVTVARGPEVRPATFRAISTRENQTRAAVAVQPTAPQPAAQPASQSVLDQRLDRIEKLVAGLVTREPETAPVAQAASDATRGIRALLQNADVSASMIDTLFAESLFGAKVESDLIATFSELLTRKLAEAFCPSIPFKPGDRVVFFGPAGSGKTSVMGKLAARLVFQEKRRVTLVSLDRVKIGAMEELQSYADILGARTKDYETAAKEIDVHAITLIDAPAWSPDAERQKDLASLVAAMKPNIRFAVFSALTRSSDVSAIKAELSVLNPTHTVATMLDLTKRWGGLLSIADVDAKLAYTTAGPAGIGSVTIPDINAISSQILASEGIRG